MLARNRDVLAQAVTPIDTGTGLLNSDCSAMQMLFFTSDHQGETLAHIVQSVKDWNTAFHAPDSEFAEIAPKVEFKLASGQCWCHGGTNEAVEEADKHELAAIFGAITLMCLLTFRSFGATLCIILPLALVSLLNNALMASLDIGLKVSTLPVIALGGWRRCRLRHLPVRPHRGASASRHVAGRRLFQTRSASAVQRRRSRQ